MKRCCSFADEPKPNIEVGNLHAARTFCSSVPQIQANNGRVYSFFEFDCPNHRRRRSYSSLLDYTAISFARGIAEYIEKSSEDSHHKHNIELVHDLSVIHIYFMTALATLAFAISIFPIARTKVIIDANTGTLTILKGSILVRHGGLERNNSGHIVSSSFRGSLFC